MSLLNLALGQYPSTADGDLRAQLQPLYNAIHNLADYVNGGSSILPGGGGGISTSGPMTAAEIQARIPSNPFRLRMTAAEDLTYGDVVTFTQGTVSGIANAVVRKAEARIFKEYTPNRWTWPFTMGICTSVDGITNGQSGEITLGPAIIYAYNSLAAGFPYYLSKDTPGALTGRMYVYTDEPTTYRQYPFRNPVGIALTQDVFFLYAAHMPHQIMPSFDLVAP